jgi:hypothetical protein
MYIYVYKNIAVLAYQDHVYIKITDVGSLALGFCLDQRGKGRHLSWRRERAAVACRDGGGSTGGSLTKGTGARIPKAENERKRSRAQPPAAEQRMREEEAGNRWMKSWAMGSILLTLVDQITSPNAHLEVQLSRPVKVHILGNGQHINHRKSGRLAP